MRRYDPQLVALARSISDGSPVDWEKVRRESPRSTDRRILQQLEVLSEIARVHRPVGSVDQELDVECAGRVSPAPQERSSPPLQGRWGRLQILERVGAGAFGSVYRAWDGDLEREVALKILEAGPERSVEGAAVRTLVAEGRRLARLRHPNVITVHGIERHGGRLGLWMEFVRGRTLEDVLLEQGPFGAREAALVGVDLCRALTAVHRAGMVHRDVKTRNVMREEGGRIVLMDFGAGAERIPSSASSLAGTPHYIAPEILSGGAPGVPSDLYSLGVLLYRLVTNAYPARARSDGGRGAAEDDRIVSLREVRPELPEAFVRVVDRALAAEPLQRFASAGQMELALISALGLEPPTFLRVPGAELASPHDTPGRRSLRVGPTTGVVLLVAGLVAAGAVVWIGIASLQRGPRTRPADPSGAGATVSPPTHGAMPSTPIPESTPVASSRELAEGAPPPKPAAGEIEAHSDVPSADGELATAAYQVAAGFWRQRAGLRERIVPGARLELGDGLSLEFEASEPVYLYVINEDEAGSAYLLFPLPGFELGNPLPGRRAHLLPGRRAGRPKDWIVTSAGGREHLLLIASRERLEEFETEMRKLPAAGSEGYPQISESAKSRLRGIGGVGEASQTSISSRHLFDLAARLAARLEVVRGTWMRQVDFENPAP